MTPRDARAACDAAKARLVQDVVAFAFGEPVEEIAAATRRAKGPALARQAAMYLTHVACGMSLGRVAVAFGRDRSTVSHACSLIEDRRDEPGFDACIGRLEAFLRAAPPPFEGPL